MSGNAKDRRRFRRGLARRGLRYVPRSDWRRILIDPRVYLALPDYVDSYVYPAATAPRFPSLVDDRSRRHAS